MEDLALDRAALEHPPLGRVELVEAGREQRLQGRRHLDLVARLIGHRQHLADEQRVAAGRAGDPLAQLLRHSRADQARRVLAAQRLEPHRHRPGGAAVEQLRARHAQDQDRGAAREQRDVLDQVEERLLAPLDVVEHDDERRLLLEQLPERPGDLLRRRSRLRLAEQRTDRRRRGRIGRERVELLDDLDDRPVGDPVPVRQTAAAHDPRLDQRQRLRHEPGLPEARITDDRDQLTAPLRPSPPPRLAQQRQLALAPDEHRVVPPLRRLTRSEQPERRHRLALPLQRQRLDRLHVDRVPDQRTRRLRDQHLPRRRRLLQPGRHVERITGRQPLLRPGHHLTRVHPDPPLDPQPRERLPHLHRRPARPQRVVLVHDRHPEHRHHRITDELLHRTAVRSTIPFIRSKYRASSARNASGSVDSPSAVDPTTSQNSTVTTFRCSPDPPPSTAPHASQNLAVVAVLMTAGCTDHHGRSLDRIRRASRTTPGLAVVPDDDVTAHALISRHGD